jgi:hypothetical protein
MFLNYAKSNAEIESRLKPKLQKRYINNDQFLRLKVTVLLVVLKDKHQKIVVRDKIRKCPSSAQ